MAESDSDPAVVRLACPSCGAMLPLPAGTTEYLQCPFCGSSLHMRRSAGALSLEMVQQVGRAIGQEVGQELDQRFEAMEARQQLQMVEMQLLDLQVQLRTLKSLPKSRQRDQAIKQTAAQVAQLQRQYGVVYARLYPQAARSSARAGGSGGRALAKTQPGWGCIMFLVGVFVLACAMVGLGYFGVSLAVLGALLALMSPGYREWLASQPGYRRRMARLPGMRTASPVQLAICTLLYLLPLSAVAMDATVRGFAGTTGGKSTPVMMAGIGLFGLWLLYGWGIRGWRLPADGRLPFSAAAIFGPLRTNVVALGAGVIAALLPVVVLGIGIVVTPDKAQATRVQVVPTPTIMKPTVAPAPATPVLVAPLQMETPTAMVVPAATMTPASTREPTATQAVVPPTATATKVLVAPAVTATKVVIAPTATATGVAGAHVEITRVELGAERVTVQNTGSVAQDLTGWWMLSVEGSQRYRFPAGFVLGPGESVVVVSGRETAGPGELLWSRQNIHNDKGDVCELYDAQGTLVSRR